MTDVRPDAQRVTLQDVADRAGVSLTTASRVVNDGARRVGKELADRVHKAAGELGYTANLQARAVATGQSTMIGVALRDISDPYFSSIAAGLIEVADAGRLLVCMTSTAAHEAAEREYVALMRAQRARAVVLVGSRSDSFAARDALRAELDAFTRSGGRAACVGQDLLGIDTVQPENRAGADALARALAALGHRRFAVLGGPRALLTAQDRVAGFAAGLRAWSVPLEPGRVVHGELSRDGGYQAMSEVLAAGAPLPDCVFAVSDIMAVGALARLRAAGIDVPATWPWPASTTSLRCAMSTRRSPRCGCRLSSWARSPPGWCSTATRPTSRGWCRCRARSCCATAPSRGRLQPADYGS